MVKVRSIEALPLRIPFEDGGGAAGLMPGKAWTSIDIALVKLTSEDGVVGWGEAFAYSCMSATVAAVREMVAPLVVGRDIDDIPALNLDVQRKLHLQGRYGSTQFAISGVDIALWDAKAKHAGVSVASLLGGAKRASVPAYASLVRYGDPVLVERYAAEAVAEGYRDVKLHEITLPTIEAGRRGAGPGIRLTTDINCNWSAADAERLMPEMKRLDLFWVEEPLFPPDDEQALARLIERYGVSIATGENACTAVEFARTTPHVTYPQPSVTKVGGISEFIKVLDIARAAGKVPMPHSPYFGPGYWATLQIAAARTEVPLFEYLWIRPQAWLDATIPLPNRGDIAIPDKPGLGFEPDMAVLGRFAA